MDWKALSSAHSHFLEKAVLNPRSPFYSIDRSYLYRVLSECRALIGNTGADTNTEVSEGVLLFRQYKDNTYVYIPCDGLISLFIAKRDLSHLPELYTPFELRHLKRHYYMGAAGYGQLVGLLELVTSYFYELREGEDYTKRKKSLQDMPTLISPGTWHQSGIASFNTWVIRIDTAALTGKILSDKRFRALIPGSDQFDKRFIRRCEDDLVLMQSNQLTAFALSSAKQFDKLLALYLCNWFNITKINQIDRTMDQLSWYLGLPSSNQVIKPMKDLMDAKLVKRVTANGKVSRTSTIYVFDPKGLGEYIVRV